MKRLSKWEPSKGSQTLPRSGSAGQSPASPTRVPFATLVSYLVATLAFGSSAVAQLPAPPAAAPDATAKPSARRPGPLGALRSPRRDGLPAGAPRPVPPAPPPAPPVVVPGAPKPLPPAVKAAAPAARPAAPAAAPKPGAVVPAPPPGTPGLVDIPGEKEFNSCHKLPPGKRIVRLNLKPDTEVMDLIGWISSITCTQFIVSVPVQGKKLTIIAPQLITPEEAYRLFFSALDSLGLTVEPTGQVPARGRELARRASLRCRSSAPTRRRRATAASSPSWCACSTSIPPT